MAITSLWETLFTAILLYHLPFVLSRLLLKKRFPIEAETRRLTGGSRRSVKKRPEIVRSVFSPMRAGIFSSALLTRNGSMV
jgi:hypothetical protein